MVFGQHWKFFHLLDYPILFLFYVMASDRASPELLFTCRHRTVSIHVHQNNNISLFDNEALTSKSATFKTNNLLCGGYPCCKRSAIWQPGELTQNTEQTDQVTIITRGRPHASG